MSSAKPEAKEAAPERPAAEAAPAPGGLSAWLPAAAAVLLAPLATLGVAQFVLLPRLQQKLAAPVPAETAPAEAPPAAKGGKEGKDEKGGAGNSYDFANVVVNLAGTMGTRYLKTSFTVTGADATFKPAFETNKARLTDVTLNVLSALTLADLEEPGSKNLLRDKLVAAYNQTLGRHVVDQVYFSDFLVQ